MTLDEYQEEALRTHPPVSPEGRALAIAVLGLGVGGEAGEVEDLVKKHVGHGHDMDLGELTKELGDVLWYVAVLAHQFGISMHKVGAANIAKLRKRYPDGFSPEASRNRKEE